MGATVIRLGRTTGVPWLAKEPGRQNWYIYWLVGTRVKRRSTKTTERLLAEGRLSAFIQEFNGGRKPRVVQPYWSTVAKIVTERHRRSAKKRGMSFSLTPQYVLRLLERSKFRCSISGIAFSTERGDFHKNQWAPSIDRIDNRHGYEVGNVRIVCIAANLAMNEFGYDALLRLAHGIVNSSFESAEEPDLEELPSASSS